MAKKKVGKKKRFLSVVKNTPTFSGLKAVSLKSNYFARFRYSPHELLTVLRSERVRTLQINSQTREILDDLGYWSLVRAENGQFILDTELEAQLIAQNNYLERSMTYLTNDIIWAKKNNNTYAQAQIVDHLSTKGLDFFKIKFINEEQSEIHSISKYELDQINLIGCFLPQDIYESEKIDWDNDLIWRKKLENFKSKMADKNFFIDFRKSDEEIMVKKTELVHDILDFFKINIGSIRQTGRGLGLLSCGEGTILDQYFIYISAIQAVGHIFGIRLANIETLANNFFNEVNQSNLSLVAFKSISEVADRLIARGPLASTSSEQTPDFFKKSLQNSKFENYLV